MTTLGTREELLAASTPCIEGMTKFEMYEFAAEEEPSPEMSPGDAAKYRGISARLNYLFQDRVDIQHSCNEASRRMAKPRVGDWKMLKRIGRYLVGAPRYVQ